MDIVKRPAIGPASGKRSLMHIQLCFYRHPLVFLERVECREKSDKGDTPLHIQGLSIESETTGTIFRLDACITRDPNLKRLDLSNIAAIVEVKKSTEAADVTEVSLHIPVPSLQAEFTSKRPSVIGCQSYIKR